LAASWVWGDELEIAGFCEIDDYCGKVLNKNFPGVPIYKDITKLDGKQFKNIDLITGGFPCQDISVAGRGAGLEDGTRSGLWFEMLRIISEVRPGYALIENVPMLTLRGGTRVIADLTQIGYDASWTIISAQDVGAWHKRKRIWIVAYPGHLCRGNNVSGDVGLCSGEQFEKAIGNASQFEITGSSQESETMAQDVPDTAQHRLQRSSKTGNNGKNRQKPGYKFSTRCNRGREYWAVEPNVGRVANGVPKRVDRLKGLGNAIVPQCSALIMNRIKELI